MQALLPFPAPPPKQLMCSILMQQNYFQNNGFVERNPLPPVQCCFLQKSRLSFDRASDISRGHGPAKFRYFREIPRNSPKNAKYREICQKYFQIHVGKTYLILILAIRPVLFTPNVQIYAPVVHNTCRRKQLCFLVLVAGLMMMHNNVSIKLRKHIIYSGTVGW